MGQENFLQIKEDGGVAMRTSPSLLLSTFRMAGAGKRFVLKTPSFGAYTDSCGFCVVVKGDFSFTIFV